MTFTVEVLEARIAPASVFVSGKSSGATALKVFTESGADAQDTLAETLARTAAGATAAVQLFAGDQLIFDADGNHVFSKGDYVLMEVKAGSAMVFLTNNAAGKTLKAFEKNEISGLALSDGFAGIVHTDVNGTVMGALDGTGAFTGNGSSVDVVGSIAGLTIEGQVAGGHLLAGRDLAHVTIAGKHFNTKTAQGSVSGRVATGTATHNLAVSFNGGAQTFTTSFAGAAGEDGGDIRDLTLAYGAAGIFAGDGLAGAGATADGGTGGSLINVRVNSPALMTVSAGQGGAGSAGGSGGAGGDIVHADFVLATKSLDPLTFTAGNGGDGVDGPGGGGGSFTDVSVRLPKTAASLVLRAGNGGNSGAGFAGAVGGAFQTLDLEISQLRGPGELDRSLQVLGGAGGASTDGLGGAGGSIAGVNYTTVKSKLGSLRALFAGGAGSDGSGAHSAGAGGEVRQVNAILNGSLSELRLSGGRAGDAASSGVPAAQGGGVDDVQVLVRNSPRTDVAIFGGAGGGAIGAPAGTGGTVSDVTFINEGKNTGAFSATGGNGGTAVDDAGGTGGQVSGITIQNTGTMIDGMRIAGGGGGTFEDTGAGLSSTGVGGAATRIVVNNHGRMTGDNVVTGGGFSTTALLPVGMGNVGATGTVSDVTVNDTVGTFTDLHPFLIATAAVAVEAQGPGGGAGGDISGLHLNGPKSVFVVAAGAGGDSAAAFGLGGLAGSISGVSGRIGKLILTAGGGGSADSGSGGAGGSIRDISLGSVGKFVQLLAAGNGGNGLFAGEGGDVSDISIPGAIGDFSKNFNLFAAHLDDTGGDGSPGMGGLVAGKGGSGIGSTNGSIDNVAATKIAAIVAGRPLPDRIGYENAVAQISNLHTQVLGADVKKNKVFNFVEGGTNLGYQPDGAMTPTDFDRALDGLVIVKAGQAMNLPVTPLKLIEV